MSRLPLGVQVLRPLDDARLLAGVEVWVHAPWRWYVPRPGIWRPEPMERLLAPLRAAGLRLGVILGPAMPHIVPDGVEPGQLPTAFADACGRIAAALPDVTAFRVEDQLNASRWERLRTRRRRGAVWADPAFQVDLLRGGLEAVAAARPDAARQVTVDADLPRWRSALDRWRAAGLSWERLGIARRPCRWLPDPELAAAIGDAVAGLGGAVDVLTAYATASDRFPPRAQRDYLERAVAVAQDAGAASLIWLALRDQAHDDPLLGYWTPARERHLGLLYYDGLPKAAADSFRVLATGRRF